MNRSQAGSLPAHLAAGLLLALLLPLPGEAHTSPSPATAQPTAAPAAAQANDCKCKACPCPKQSQDHTDPKKATCKVVVDGLNQAVTLPTDCGWPHLKPGNTVEVEVQRAHLLHYRYEVRITGTEDLQASYGVVGVGELQDSATQSFSGAVASPGVQADRQVDSTTDLQALLRQAREGVTKASNDAAKLIDDFEQVDRLVAGLWEKESTDKWPADYEKASDAFMMAYPETREQLGKSWANVQRAQDEVFIRLAAAPQDSLLTSLQGSFTALAGQAKEATAALDRTAIRVRRWEEILKRDPVVRQTFLVDRRSKRYTVSVFREPLSEAARQLEVAATSAAASSGSMAPITGTGGTGSGTGSTPAGATATPAAATTAAARPAFASFSYEGRAQHRFNVSLGAAALYRPERRTFAVDARVNPDNTISYFVGENTTSEFGLEPVAMLGTYFNPVDNYDPDRKGAWMITVGTEISSSPTTYLLGLAYDWNPGFSVAFGLTRYEKTDTADGWSAGQAVPAKADGTAAITTVPTRKEDDLGFYTAFVFRPAIFSAFWNRRK